MEKRLDWELDGVRAFELSVAGEVDGLYAWKRFDDRGDGVVPYGLALPKL